MKKQLGLRIEARLKDALDDRAQRLGVPVTSLLEKYISDGLARDNGELIEESSLPVIRQAVKEEVARSFSQLYQQLAVDVEKATKRGDDRLAKLLVRVGRSSHTMLWMFRKYLEHPNDRRDPNFPERIYKEAAELAGKYMARSGDDEQN